MGPRSRPARLQARHRWDRFAAHDDPPETALLDGVLGAEAPGTAVYGAGDTSDEPDTSDAKEPADEVLPDSGREERRWALSAGLGVVVVALLGLCAGLWWWSSIASAPDIRPVDAPEKSSPAKNASAASGSTTMPDDGDRAVVVHVAGAVTKPGVVRLPQGSRVHEAIAAAGGVTADAEQDRLNLAAPVEDGSRIVVPRAGEASEVPTGSAAAASPAGGGGTQRSSKVNLNSATVEDLATLPRVGPVLAQRIIQYRTQHGRFTSVDGLDAVPGIGPAMLESLRPLVTV